MKVINQVWDDVCKVAEVKDKTSHSARHVMGRYIIEKTGNWATRTPPTQCSIPGLPMKS